MASLSSTAVASDHNAPIAVVDDNDNGAWVLICNAFGLTVILITLIVRIYIRVRVSPPFGIDDHFLIGATALSAVQVSIVFAQVDDGFGRAIELLDPDRSVQTQRVRLFLLRFVTILTAS